MRRIHLGSRLLGSWRFALEQIVASPLRTWTSIIACSWGIVFLVFFDSFLYELRTMNVEPITKAALSEKVWDIPTDLDWALAKQLDGIHMAGISFVPWAALKARGNGAPVMGVTRSFFDLEGMRLLWGRPMLMRDGLAGSQCCWVSARSEPALAQKGRATGELVIDEKVLQVMGAYELPRRQHPLIGYDWAGLRPWHEDSVLIPLSTAVRILPEKTGRFSVLVSVGSPKALLESWDEISLTLEELGLDADAAAPRETAGFSEALEQLFLESRKTIVVTQALIFFFAWANATNLMLRQIRQRTREIGIMKSLGASRRWIFLHVMRESGLIGILSGLFGVLVGVGMVDLVGVLIQWKVSLHPEAMKLGFVCGLIAPLTIPFLPAWVGSRMLPTRALRE